MLSRYFKLKKMPSWDTQVPTVWLFGVDHLRTYIINPRGTKENPYLKVDVGRKFVLDH